MCAIMNTEKPNRFQRRKQRTRNALKQAAMDLLLAYGYDNLTVQAITDRADFARGTFYVHFADKDDIVWALLEESMASLLKDTIGHITNESPMRRKYLLWQRVFLYAQENQALLRVLVGENGHPAYAVKIQDFFGTIIEQGIKGGTFDPQIDVGLPPEFLAQFMTGALVRLMLWSLDTDYTPSQLAQMFYEVIYREPMPPEIA